jgi:osmotically-inducible protein OsmY
MLCLTTTNHTREFSNVKADCISIEARRIVRIFLVLSVIIFNAGAARAQQSETALMHRVDRALRADDRLNGASAYTASPGVIVLYGRVFDEKDSKLAEQTAGKVPGVTNVVNTLHTMTGKWLAEESRINDTLQLNGFQDVSVKVVGPEAYLSGQVNSDSEKQRAVTVVSSVSKLQVVNFIRVVPGPLLSAPGFF